MLDKMFSNINTTFIFKLVTGIVYSGLQTKRSGLLIHQTLDGPIAVYQRMSYIVVRQILLG